MRVFLRWLSILVLLIAAVLLISPYFIGRSVDKHLPELIKEMSSSSLHCKTISLKRGWFSSTATIEVSADPTHTAQGQKNPMAITIEEKIYHGFIVPYINNQGKHWTLAYASSLIHSDGSGGTPLDISGVWGFSSKMLYFTANNYQDVRNGLRFTVHKLDGRIAFSDKAQTLEGNITLAQLQIDKTQSDSETFAINNAAINMDAQEQNHLWVGQHRFSVENIALQSGNKHATLNQLQFTAEQSQRDGKLFSSFAAKLGALTAPSFNLNNLDFLLSFNNIDSAALSQFAEKAKQVDTQEQVMQLIPLAMNIVSKGFNVKLERLNVETNMGPINVEGKVSVPPSQTQQNNLAMLLHSLTASVNMSAPRVIYAELITDHFESNKLHIQHQLQGHIVSAKQLAHEAIEQWIQNGMFIANDDNLKMDITFEGGKVLVNGRAPNFGLPTPAQPKQAPLPDVNGGAQPQLQPSTPTTPSHDRHYQMHDITPSHDRQTQTTPGQ